MDVLDAVVFVRERFIDLLALEDVLLRVRPRELLFLRLNTPPFLEYLDDPHEDRLRLRLLLLTLLRLPRDEENPRRLESASEVGMLRNINPVNPKKVNHLPICNMIFLV